MRIAIVHDSLMEFGGAEKVLISWLKIWPKADIYTSAVNPKILKLLPANSLNKSILDYLPYIRNKTPFLQLLSPLIWRSFSLEKYDLVISNSSFALCNTIKVKNPYHIAYLLCPPKNLFDLSDRWTMQNIIPYTSILKRYYQKSLKQNISLVTISKYMKSVFYKKFKIKTDVIYPPVLIPKNINKKSGSYFVTASRLGKEKSLEIAICAFNALKLPLKIVGIGKNYRNLKKIAGPTIEFLGFLSDEQKYQLLQKAKAFIFCAKNEDFGIAPAEAMANGLPVIAHYSGGLKETIINNQTGLFYYQHSAKALITAVHKFNPDKFDPQFLHQYSKKFSEEKFRERFKQYISHLFKAGIYK